MYHFLALAPLGPKGRTRRNVTDCVRGSIYNFFVRRPQNEYFAACIEDTKYEMYFAA